ncbi:YjbF family lipoprotein [Paracoccus pacificus]|uniref:YjbF family lipoprotein n=1 Tax=Paracoccus pacificus TaxID=1463598 RepID=A0ABW4RA45_9RHOB
MRRGAGSAALLAVLALAGCSSKTVEDQNKSSLFGSLRQAVSQTVASRRGGDEAAAAQTPDSPQDIAARALAANPGPLILAGLESSGATQAMAVIGENNGVRTFATTNMQALLLRRGMLTGTKGLGHDLSAAEIRGSEALIRARRAGSATRTMYFIGGDGLERPLPVNCQIAPGAAAGPGQRVVESCEGYGVKFQNNYLVTSGGGIPVSRQWISPNLGYVTIQILRD